MYAMSLAYGDPTFNTAGRRFKLSPHGINWERSEYKKKLTEFHISTFLMVLSNT